MRSDVLRLLQSINPDWRGFELHPLTGDASARAYYRVCLDADEPDLILMVLGETGGAEEFGADRRPDDELPFLYMQRFLTSVEVPVPPIYAWCPDARLMILGDLGDTTLSAWVEGQGLDAAIPLYERALSHLARLQVKGTEAVLPGSQLDRQRYCEQCFLWEFNHFLEFSVEAAGLEITPDDRRLFDQTFQRIAVELSQLPRVVVHRDYHSRNLMVVGDDVGIIDFQDALLGPAAYDVVSLLNDAYITLDQGHISNLTKHYLGALEAQGAPYTGDFDRAFALCTLNRSLKAAGRFAFFHHTAGNDRYLRYVPTTLRNARAALESQGDLRLLQTALSRYVPELS